MFFREHGPPHFHAEYSGQQAVVGIEDLAVLRGRLPPVALGIVGQGQLVAFAEDPNYPAYPEATQLLFMNAVLLGPGRCQGGRWSPVGRPR